MYVIYYVQCRKPRVRERARVTMATRLCARAEHSVNFRISKTLCCSANPSERLAMAHWISKLPWVIFLIFHNFQCRKPHVRERARVSMVTRLCARVEHSFCIAHNRPVAMLVWQSK